MRIGLKYQQTSRISIVRKLLWRKFKAGGNLSAWTEKMPIRSWL